MKQIKLTHEEANLLLNGNMSPVRRADIGNTGYAIESPHWRVIRKDCQELSDSDIETIQAMLKSCDYPPAMPEGELDRAWAKKAIRDELEALRAMSGDNPHKPGSSVYATFIRLGSIIKGSGQAHYSYDRILAAVIRYCPADLKTKGNRERDITYLFKRAYGFSKPRYRLIK